jgi:S1-C subfamily serine protease
MKNLPYLSIIILIILWIKLFIINTNTNYINNINKSIVIIIPEEKLIDYKNNPNWILENYKSSWIWVGFIISSNWKVQTVNHIIENNNIKYKIILNNKEYNTKIISRNKSSDLAILKILSSNNEIFQPLEIENNNTLINDLDEVYSYWVDIQNLKIISNTWTIINKKSKLGNISNLLEISNNIKPWFSGWPIINKKWKVVWINYAISEWKSYWISF